MFEKKLKFSAIAALAVTTVVLSQLTVIPARAADPQSIPAPVVQSGLNQLNDISQAFTAVAKSVSPIVVSIKTEKTIKPKQQTQQQFQGQPSPFGNGPFDDFFDRFFQPYTPEGEQHQTALGSGVIMTPDGYIITNNHVIANFDDIQVTLSDERTFTAKIIGADPKTDVAVIKIEAKDLPAIRIGNSDSAQVGEWVLAIGNPMGLAHTITAGIISAVGRTNLQLADYENFIQTDAAINPGNSGGALVNLRGELIGINTAIATNTGFYNGVGFAIPSNMAKRVMESLITKGKVVRGWLGIHIQDINDNIASALNVEKTTGALITNVEKDSPADKAGFKTGDFITAINGAKIKDTNQLRNIVADIAPNTKVTVDLIRDKKKKTITVTLGELPDDQQLAVQKPAKKQAIRLGLELKALTKDLAQQYGYKSEKGLVVTQVTPGGPAAAAGIQPGDLIREINQQETKSMDDYDQVMEKIKKGDALLILLERRGNVFFIGLKIPIDKE